MTIYIIAFLLENCPYCDELEKKYWNNYSDESWLEIIKKYNFVPHTFKIPRKEPNRTEFLTYLQEQNITYINSFPFILACYDGDYNIDSVNVFCARKDNLLNKFIYLDNQSPPCRNTQNFKKWLDSL